MKQHIIDVLVFTISVALISLLVCIGIGAIDKSDTAECLKLKKQSEMYANHFYLTEWQKDMCEYQGVAINAPVK